MREIFDNLRSEDAWFSQFKHFKHFALNMSTVANGMPLGVRTHSLNFVIDTADLQALVMAELRKTDEVEAASGTTTV